MRSSVQKGLLEQLKKGIAALEDVKADFPGAAGKAKYQELKAIFGSLDAVSVSEIRLGYPRLKRLVFSLFEVRTSLELVGVRLRS